VDIERCDAGKPHQEGRDIVALRRRPGNGRSGIQAPDRKASKCCVTAHLCRDGPVHRRRLAHHLWHRFCAKDLTIWDLGFTGTTAVGVEMLYRTAKYPWLESRHLSVLRDGISRAVATRWR